MIKRSVSFVIRDAHDSGRVLGVRRPPDDDALPNAWGLPAGTLGEGESWEDAVRRAGREKLGVELEVGALLEEGELERGDRDTGSYTLRMRLYEARVATGQPRVPQPFAGVTQYAALEWVPPDRFEAAAAAGSLCCRLYLRAVTG